MPKSTEDLIELINRNHQEAVTKTKDELDAVRAEVQELAQMVAMRTTTGSGRAQGPGWIGANVARSPELAALTKGGLKGSVSMVIENSTITTGSGSAGALIAPDVRTDDAATLGQKRMFLRSLLRPGETSSDLVRYARQTGFTNNAGAVSEGATKPESAITWSEEDAPVQVIAHWFPATRQALSDAPQLEGLIDSIGRYGVMDAEENELLYGDGSSSHIYGIVPQASAYNPALFAVANETRFDEILKGIAQVEQALYPCNGVAVNSLDWRKLQSIKDSQGRYIGGGPLGANVGLAWQVPVIPSPNVPSGKFLCGSFDLGAQLFDRAGITVEVGVIDQYFIQNKLAVLIEERVALAVRRPESFVWGTFTTESA